MDRGAWWATVSWLQSVQFSSVAQLGPTFGDSMHCSMPGLPVHHQFPELAQTHVCRVGDAIQPSHPLSSPSPPAFNLSKRQGLFQWVGSAAYNESACNESVSCRESDITKGLTLSLSLTLLGLLEQQQWNIHSHTLSSQSKRDIRFCSKESLKYLIFPWHGINEVLMVPWY